MDDLSRGTATLWLGVGIVLLTVLVGAESAAVQWTMSRVQLVNKITSSDDTDRFDRSGRGPLRAEDIGATQVVDLDSRSF